MKNSFQKLTQFSQGINVLDAFASITLVSFKRYMCFSNSAVQAIWNKEILSPLWKTHVGEVIPPQN
jgi:hypothetical protein